MNLFLQGMRRSGTTIVFDILSQDERLDLYYEPLSAGKVGALGGGSGTQELDLMEKIRSIRARFAEEARIDLTNEDFNQGAPRDPELELQEELPEFCIEYLRFLCRQSSHTAIKFTRMYSRIPLLAKVAPDSYLVVLVRDPKEVVASYLYGRDQRRRERYRNRDQFFETRSGLNAWKSRDFHEGICRQWNKPEWADAADWLRPLLVWHYTFKRTYEGALQAYPGRHLVSRYEDLAGDPVTAIESIYHLAEMSPSQRAIDWASHHIRESRKECYRDDPRWEVAFSKYGIRESIVRAGYAN